jgi:diadenylate cyclase
VGTLLQFDIAPALRSFIERAWDRPLVTFFEMLLIGSVVYIVLRFLQGTRGARLVRAVAIILIVSFAVVRLLAETYELDRVRVIYPYFILGVFLISLVAFQTELRRMLMRLGDADWLQRWAGTSKRMIEDLVAAVEHLSKKKIGALIAIERTTEVGGVIETGTILDALVSTDLLETIFWPGTALHDLGVIIRKNRIVAAGCQFPLAESGELERALGSRHRAGLGMSHEADAVVVIVSEETGTISVVVRGRMQRSLTPETLRETLVRELLTTARGEPRVRTPRSWFRRPWRRKVSTGQKVPTDGATQAS